MTRRPVWLVSAARKETVFGLWNRQNNNNCPSDTVCAANSSSCVPWGVCRNQAVIQAARLWCLHQVPFLLRLSNVSGLPSELPFLRTATSWILRLSPILIKMASRIIFNAGYSSQYHLMISVWGKDCSVKAGHQHFCNGSDGSFPVPTWRWRTWITTDHWRSFPKVRRAWLSMTKRQHLGQYSDARRNDSGCWLYPEHAPLVVNVDNAGPPEIIWGYSAVRYVPLPTPHFDQLWTLATPPTLPQMGYTAVAADLDGMTKPEIVISNKVVDGITGADKTKSIQAGILVIRRWAT